MHNEETNSFVDYKNCLLDVKSKSIYRKQLMFRNKKHKIQTIEVNKVALNRNDDKMIVKKNGISTTHYAETQLSKHNTTHTWPQLIMLKLLTRGYITRIKNWL